jgi:hypothetical protein
MIAIFNPSSRWAEWLFAQARRLAGSPCSIYAIMAAIIVADGVILGPFSYLRWHDLGDSHVSRYVALVQRVHDGMGFALWYPEAAGGVDILANGARYFDGFFLLFNLMPAWLAVGVMRFAQMLIGAIFMNRILREHAGLSYIGAFFGGLAYLVLQRNLLELYFGVGAIPFVLWALVRLHEKPRLRGYLGAAVLGAAWSIFSFMHLTFMFCIPGMACWLWFVARRFDIRMVGLLATLGFAYGLCQADMLVSMVVNSSLSHRTHWDLSLPPWPLVADLILSQAFSSIEYGVLAGIALILGARSRFIRIVLVLITITLAVSLLQYHIRLVLPERLNVLKGFNMYRFVEFLPVLWAAALGWGWQTLDGILEHVSNKRRQIIGIGALATVLMLAWLPLRMMAQDVEDWIKWGSYFANYRNPQMLDLAREFRSSKIPFRVATIQEKGLLASYSNAYGLESADGYLNLYPYTYGLMWRAVIAPALARDPELENYVVNYGPRLSLFTEDGRDYPKRVVDYFNTNLLSLLGVRYIISKVPIEGEGLTLVPATQPDVFWTGLSIREKIERRLVDNFSGRPFLLYQNEHALPRWFFVLNTEIIPDDKALQSRLMSMTAANFRHTALVSTPDLQGLPSPTNQLSNVVDGRYGPDRLVLDVDVPEQSFLVVANSYSPFWVCRIDGKPVPIIRTNLALSGVSVPAMAKTVEFTYEPPYRLIANRQVSGGALANVP